MTSLLWKLIAGIILFQTSTFTCILHFSQLVVLLVVEHLLRNKTNHLERMFLFKYREKRLISRCLL